MHVVACVIHHIEFELPTTQEEYNSGKLHDNVEAIYNHTKQHSNCKFEEIVK